ncbi:MAG: 3'-5' exonuclease, partial [Nevskiales bacterium]
APEIVDWFNSCFTRIFPSSKNSATGDILYSPSVAQRPADNQAGVDIHALPAKAQQAEAQSVAERILSQQAANPNARIALLAKARTHLPHILEALRKRGIHFSGQDIDALTALPVVRDLVATAKALWHPQDSLSWAVMLRAPWVGLSWADMVALSTGRKAWNWPRRLAEYASADQLSEEGRARVERFNAALESVQNADHLRPRLPDRVEALWTLLGGPACIDSHDLADARRCLQLLRKHCPGGELADLQALNRAIDNLYATPKAGDVEVMTIHKAKGLEFDHVILVGAGRKSRSDDKPLLHLRETEYGELLVPKAPEHWAEEDSQTAQGWYNYVHELEKRSKATEVLRLLYVAITRAKRTLDIFVCADVDEEKGFNPPKGSFADLLRPMIEAAFSEQPAADDNEKAAPEIPRAERIQLPFVAPEEERLYQPREIRKLLPSEKVLSAAEDKHQQESDNVYAILVGILYHQAMEKICNDGLQSWRDKAADYPLSLAAGFRRMGLPEPQVDPAVQRVLALVEKSITGKNGQWLIADKTWGAAEYPLAGYQNGEWISASIDRCFIDEDGTLWVIDYKTSDMDVNEAERDSWLAQRKEHYRPQLESYTALMAAMHKDKNI